MNCLESDGFAPAHRLTRRPTLWAQAVVKPTPKGTTVNEIIESALAQYARLEASSDDNNGQVRRFDVFDVLQNKLA